MTVPAQKYFRFRIQVSPFTSLSVFNIAYFFRLSAKLSFLSVFLSFLERLRLCCMHGQQARAVSTVRKTNAQSCRGIRNDLSEVRFRQKQRREQGLAYRLGCASAYFRMQRSPPQTRTRALHVHKIRFVPWEILRTLRMTGLYRPAIARRMACRALRLQFSVKFSIL